MHFTSYQALELLLRFDEAHLKQYGHGGMVDAYLVHRVLCYYKDVNLWPYQPPLLSTAI